MDISPVVWYDGPLKGLLMCRIIILSFLVALSACSTPPVKDITYPTSIVFTEGEYTQPVSTPASKESISKSLGLAFDRSEWSKHERIAFILSFLANLADLYTSVKSDETCIETNLILGENPSNAALAGVKVFALSFEYWLYNTKKFDIDAPTYYYGYTSALIHARAAWSNSRNNCYRG